MASSFNRGQSYFAHLYAETEMQYIWPDFLLSILSWGSRVKNPLLPDLTMVKNIFRCCLFSPRAWLAKFLLHFPNLSVLGITPATFRRQVIVSSYRACHYHYPHYDPCFHIVVLSSSHTVHVQEALEAQLFLNQIGRVISITIFTNSELEFYCNCACTPETT